MRVRDIKNSIRESSLKKGDTIDTIYILSIAQILIHLQIHFLLRNQNQITSSS